MYLFIYLFMSAFIYKHFSLFSPNQNFKFVMHFALFTLKKYFFVITASSIFLRNTLKMMKCRMSYLCGLFI